MKNFKQINDMQSSLVSKRLLCAVLLLIASALAAESASPTEALKTRPDFDSGPTLVQTMMYVVDLREMEDRTGQTLRRVVGLLAWRAAAR